MLSNKDIINALNEDCNKSSDSTLSDDKTLKAVSELSESLNTFSAKFDAEMSKIHEAYFNSNNEEDNDVNNENMEEDNNE